MRTKKNRKHKRSVYIIGIVFILMIASVAWTWYKYKFANKKIHELVSKKTKGLYSIQYDDLAIDEVNGVLQVNKVRLIPDTSYYHEMVSNHDAPPVLLSLRVSGLKITGVKTPKALLNKEITGAKLEVDHPEIEIGVNNFLKDTSGYNPGKDVYKQVLGQLKSIHIDSIIITHANLLVRDINSGKIIFTGKNLSSVMSDFLIDSARRNDSSSILFSKDLDLRCSEIVLPSKDKKYNFQFEKLEFISQINSIKAGSIRIIPQLSEEAYAAAFRYSKDRYNFSFENIQLFHVDRKSLWRKVIGADSLFIESGSFKIYRDISHPHDSVDRTSNYPQQQLMQIPIPLYIRKIVFKNTFIEYKEKNTKSDSSGKVQFADSYATISNLTNIPSRIREKNICSLDFNSKFLGKAIIHARLDMQLASRNGNFKIKGNMQNMPGEHLNRMTEPMALARIDKGNINQMSFSFIGDNHRATGNLLLLYHDLHVSLLKKDEEKNKYTKKLIPTVATNIILKDSNPANNETRRAAINYDRDIHRSLFNLLWKSIFSGVKQSVGIK